MTQIAQLSIERGALPLETVFIYGSLTPGIAVISQLIWSVSDYSVLSMIL